jgi:hypothetical protein
VSFEDFEMSGFGDVFRNKEQSAKEIRSFVLFAPPAPAPAPTPAPAPAPA